MLAPSVHRFLAASTCGCTIRAVSISSPESHSHSHRPLPKPVLSNERWVWARAKHCRPLRVHHAAGQGRPFLRCHRRRHRSETSQTPSPWRGSRLPGLQGTMLAVAPLPPVCLPSVGVRWVGGMLFGRKTCSINSPIRCVGVCAALIQVRLCTSLCMFSCLLPPASRLWWVLVDAGDTHTLPRVRRVPTAIDCSIGLWCCAHQQLQCSHLVRCTCLTSPCSRRSPRSWERHFSCCSCRIYWG